MAEDTRAVAQGKKMMVLKNPLKRRLLLLRIDARINARNNMTGTWKAR
jgi:hypothetical protein